MRKYDNLILAVLLASILSLILSVFSVNYWFSRELLLLAITIVYSIALFYGLVSEKESVYSYAMLIFAIGILNGFFMYFRTSAKITYLLMLTNLLGFLIVLKAVPAATAAPAVSAQRREGGRKGLRKEPEVIIKEIPEEEREEELRNIKGRSIEGEEKTHKKTKAAKSIKPAHQKAAGHKNHKAKLTEAELLKAEESIVDEIDRAMKDDDEEVSEESPSRNTLARQASSKLSKPGFANKSRYEMYYDSDSGSEYYDEPAVRQYGQANVSAGRKRKGPAGQSRGQVSTKEIDEFVGALNTLEKEVKAAKQKPKVQKKAKKKR